MDLFFDPDLNIFLQTFRSGFLTGLMLVISAFGSSAFLTAAAGFVLFRLDLKKGMLILQLLLCSSLLSGSLKSWLGLPRPTDVNSSVSLLEKEYPQFLLDLFPLQMNSGFPSGHVCSTTVFWCAMILFFPGRLQRIAGTAFMLLMPLSRMYLGRHFLADVIGGFILGLLIFITGRSLLYPAFQKFIGTGKSLSPFESTYAFLFCFYLFPLPLLFLLTVPPSEIGGAARFIGVNAAMILLLVNGFPGETRDRCAGWIRLALAAFIYISLKLLLLGVITPPIQSLARASADILPAFFSTWGTIEISRRTGLYMH